MAIENLSWKRGHADWFFRHFDHAAATVQSYMLGDSPKLRGRILDVGCGDGITDLGLALRTGCEELVGDRSLQGYEKLPEIARREPPARRRRAEVAALPAGTTPTACRSRTTASTS